MLKFFYKIVPLGYFVTRLQTVLCGQKPRNELKDLWVSLLSSVGACVRGPTRNNAALSQIQIKYNASYRELISTLFININPLNAELNPICCLLALLGAHHFLHVSRIRVKSLNLRLLMSYIYIYIYGAPIFYVSRSHTTTHHSR